MGAFRYRADIIIRRIGAGVDFELLVWSGALLFLALLNPDTSTGFTLCPLKNLGIEWCPGCGLGRSVSYALHGRFADAWQAHVMGIPAVAILLTRIGSSIRRHIRFRGLTTSPTP